MGKPEVNDMDDFKIAIKVLEPDIHTFCYEWRHKQTVH